jgi:DNA polymerase-3 subunit epsilon
MGAAGGDRRRDVEQLQLERPLILFDLETTGTDPSRDKVVEIAVLRLEPDGGRLVRTRRINPERPIPAEATAVHGIRDEDVRDEPPFRRIARGLLELLEGADLAGFNVRRFDVPLLDREFRECGLDLELAGRRIVDAMTIYHRKERRDLSAAVRFYLGREHEGAHGAEADLTATADVLDAQLERYPDLPRSVEELDAWTRPTRDAVDGQGKFVRRHDEIVFAFGKHRGRSLQEVAREAPDYLEWVVGSDFPEDAKEIVRRVLKGD